MSWTWGAVLLLAMALVSQAQAQTFAVDSYVLHNGMRVLVQEDHTIPNVAMHIFLRIGPRNEQLGLTGLSHFLEHMMFRGAKRFGPGEFDRLLEAAGGLSMANTTNDITSYQNVFPRTILPLVFEMEADRLRDLRWDPKLFEAERAVILAERRTSLEANHWEALREQLWAAAFTAHPYGWPIIGWQSDIETWTIDALRRHFALGYSPSHALVVVCGDVTKTEVVQLAKKYFEPIPTRPGPPPVTSHEPAQPGERRVVVRRPAQMPLLAIAYHVPAAAHEDFPTLEVMRSVLFYGESARANQILVDRYELATSVSSELDLSLDPTLFVLAVQPKPTVPIEMVEQAVHQELLRLSREFLSDAEMQKAKNILLARFYRSLRDIHGRAAMLGNYEIFFGDHRRLFAAADRFQSVTKEDVRRVARTYFHEKNRTTAVLNMEPLEEAR